MLLSLLMVAAFAGVVETPFEPTPLPPYPEAENKGDMWLDGGAYEIYFSIREPYPFEGAYEHYRKTLGRDWVECTFSHETGWTSFGDGATDPPTYVHRFARFWANRSQSRIITLLLQYRSEDLDSSSAPDNDLQQVILLESPVVDMDAELKRMSIQCE